MAKSRPGASLVKELLLLFLVHFGEVCSTLTRCCRSIDHIASCLVGFLSAQLLRPANQVSNSRRTLACRPMISGQPCMHCRVACSPGSAPEAFGCLPRRSLRVALDITGTYACTYNIYKKFVIISDKYINIYIYTVHILYTIYEISHIIWRKTYTIYYISCSTYYTFCIVAC